MSKKIMTASVAGVLLFFSAFFALAQKTPQAGDPWPHVMLPKPEASAHLNYLGLSGSGSFQIQQIQADAVIIQIFSMYCPYCQADAPNVNRLYRLLVQDAQLKDRIKLIGIGAGNTPFEVNTYRRKYQVEFPLIPDPEFQVHRLIGEVRTPYFFVVKRSGLKKPHVVYSKLGAHADINAFLQEAIKLAGIR